MEKKSTINVLLCSLVGVLFCAQTGFAQENNPTELQKTEGLNVIKINVPALALKNFSFQYERAIGKKTSVALAVSYMPETGIPFKTYLEKQFDDPETWESFKDTRLSQFSIAPEVRFYLGQGVFRGFYIAPFAKYAKYSGDVNIGYDTNNGTTRSYLPLSGDITALSGGLQFGAQWKLSRLVYLDWWILGPNYGVSSGNLTGQRTLTADEQVEVRRILDDLEELPLVKTKSTVDNNGAKVDFDGPWAGVRAGLSIGFRF